MWKRTITTCMAVAALTCAGSAAWAAAPSDAAVDELLEVMRMREQNSTVLQLMEKEFVQNMRVWSSTSGTEISPAAQSAHALQQQQISISQILREELAWEKVRPIHRQVYKEAFTAAEVAGMITFYRTPVGQSVLQKQSQVMERAVQISREQIMPNIVQRITGVARENRKRN